jgi:hypothetical protein
MSSLAPICLFVFNRPEHTRRTIEALKRNPESTQSELYIFSDGPRSKGDRALVDALRTYLHGISGFKKIEVIERARNLGLGQSVIEGVTSVVNRDGRVIVMEDDLVTSPYFLRYMNEGLMLYENEPNVASIHGYVYPIDGLPETFFLKGADCWGWATWRDRWEAFNPDGAALLKELRHKRQTWDFDFKGSYPFTRMLEDQIAGRNKSWAIRWHASAFLKDWVTLYPGKSMVFNIGNDSSGTHSSTTEDFDVVLINRPVNLFKIDPVASPDAYQKFHEYFESTRPTLIHRIFGKLFGRRWKS